MEFFIINSTRNDIRRYESIQREKNFDDKISETYSLVGDILKTYTSGKLPKAFNILPSIENWEEIIQLTHPLQWSPQTMFEATKMFCSNLNAELTEKFYSLIFLPAIRNDIKKKK